MFLLNVRVLSKVQENFVISTDAIATLFNKTEEIFTLHTDTVLPKLQERIETWYDQNNRRGQPENIPH